MLNLLTMPNILSIITTRGDTMFHRKNTLDEILKFIDQANANQLNEIIQVVILRYGQISPDWEVNFLSLPKNDPVRRQQMLQTILQLDKHSAQ